MALPENFPSLRFCSAHRVGPLTSQVRWGLVPSSWDPGNLAFLLFKSQAPTGPWDEVADIDPGRFTYYDHDTPGVGTVRTWYYRVRLAAKDGSGYRDSKVIRVEPNPDHIATEMVRKKIIFMRHRGGVASAVFLRRRWGPHCSRCFDTTQQVATQANCPECYGTGYTGGYMQPSILPALKNVPEKMLVQAGVPYKRGDTMWEFANWPTLDTGDLVVDRVMNIRYMVDRVHPFTHRGHLVSQIVALTRVDEMSILYGLDVPQPEGSAEGRSYDLYSDPINRDDYAVASSVAH